MAAKYTNEASLIVAQAIIESAQLYVETLEDLKKQIEGCQIEYEQQASAATSAEVSRLQAELSKLQAAKNVLSNDASELNHQLSQLKESIRQKDVEIASLRQNQFSGEKKPRNSTGILDEIKILSKLQRQLKKERDFKKFRGVTISGSEAQARSLCSRNARRLRALHAVYGMCLGNTYKVIESRWAKESRHPLEDLVYLISQIQAEYGMTPKDPAYASLVPKPRVKSCKCNHAASGNAATQQQASNAATQPSGNTAATAAPNDPNAMYGLRISEGYSYQKLQMIKDFKEITGLGLKEAKDKVDNGPILYEGGLDLATANDYVRWMKARGHSLEIFPAE